MEQRYNTVWMYHPYSLQESNGRMFWGEENSQKILEIDGQNSEGCCRFTPYTDLEGGHKEAMAQKQAKAPWQKQKAHSFTHSSTWH
jgi:hypothetical protein